MAVPMIQRSRPRLVVRDGRRPAGSAEGEKRSNDSITLDRGNDGKLYANIVAISVKHTVLCIFYKKSTRNIDISKARSSIF